MFRRKHSAAWCVSLLAVWICPFSTALAKKKPPTHPININTANASELEEVPGIGPATAKKILDTRKAYGAFKSVNDLLAIKGIGPKRLEKMREYLTVGKVPAKKQSTSPERASAHAKPPPQKSPGNPETRLPPPPKTKNGSSRYRLVLAHNDSASSHAP
jgi:competence ComEA-like helix-hairpin-helix protein